MFFVARYSGLIGGCKLKWQFFGIGYGKGKCKVTNCSQIILCFYLNLKRMYIEHFSVPLPPLQGKSYKKVGWGRSCLEEMIKMWIVVKTWKKTIICSRSGFFFEEALSRRVLTSYSQSRLENFESFSTLLLLM